MLSRLRAFFRRNIAADVPPEMSFCLDCGELECSESRFAECPRRKARAAQIAASVAKGHFGEIASDLAKASDFHEGR